ncbi:DUF2905 domain-containing protein [Flectobacillus major]|jgi:hypothetical protein|uniref:DUF2905 domain-containing protein n=1 Tax=Flectobacillus major TaxID=103 RepID=UPI00040441F2|nr:DUF2905 domain-containing protein [Flectobacillus major]
MNEHLGKLLISIGAFLILGGVVIYFFHNKLQWLGRLPGDIRIEKEHFNLYIPITTCLLITGFINLVVWLFNKLNS